MPTRRLVLAGLLALPLAGCGDDLPKGELGRDLRSRGPPSRSSAAARRGSPSCVARASRSGIRWRRRRPTSAASSTRLAGRWSPYDRIAVTYAVDRSAGTVTFTSDTFGSRTLRLDGDDMLQDEGQALRTYLWQQR